MKKLVKLVLLTTFALILFQPANGQRLLKRLGDKVKNKVEQRVEKKVEDKVDEKIDEELDKVEDALEKEKKEGETNNSEENEESDREEQMEKRLQGLLKSAGISGEPVPYDENYTFDYLIQMHIESYDNNGENTSNGEFITHLNPESKSMAYEVVSGDMTEEGQGMFILDAENGAMIILSEEDGEKNGIVYGMNSFMESLGAAYEEEVDLSDTPETYLTNPNVKKTGKTKTIAGYKCELYLYNDEETDSEIWITKDLKMNTQDYFSTLFKTSMASNGMGWGYMMEAISKDKETGEKSIMKVTKVDKNSNKKFDLSGYQMTNLGNINIPTGIE